MLSLAVSLVSFALAGAASSVPVSITILILLSPHPRRGALPFLYGAVAGSIVVVGLAAAGLRVFPAHAQLDQVTVPATLCLVAGALLAGYGVHLVRAAPRPGAGRLDKLRAGFDSARAWEFAALGAGLNLRPKAILLAVAAGALIGVRNMHPVESTVLVLAYAAAAQSAVVVPVALWLRSPEHAQNRLGTLYDWMQRNGRKITAAAALAIGVFLMGYNVLQLLK
jgi:hypothetical protein